MEKVSERIMRNMIKAAKLFLPTGWGCTLLVYPHNSEGISNYISDLNRDDMIKYLRETVDQLERKQKFNTPEDN